MCMTICMMYIISMEIFQIKTCTHRTARNLESTGSPQATPPSCLAPPARLLRDFLGAKRADDEGALGGAW